MVKFLAAPTDEPRFLPERQFLLGSYRFASCLGNFAVNQHITGQDHRPSTCPGLDQTPLDQCVIEPLLAVSHRGLELTGGDPVLVGIALPVTKCYGQGVRRVIWMRDLLERKQYLDHGLDLLLVGIAIA